jgi:hypothetical protein
MEIAMNFPAASTSYSYAKPTYIKIEVILVGSDDTGHTIKADETSQEQKVNLHDAKVEDHNGIYATLSLTEERAIALNLV